MENSVDKTKKSIYLRPIELLITYSCICFFFLITCPEFTFALYMAEIPQKSQTKKEQPVERKIQLKLPLEQPFFHWNFMSRKDLLSGKLVLKIKRNGTINRITIFNNGKFSEGWDVMPFNLPENEIGEIYFGFISTNKYLTSLKDEVEIELTVTKDLSGIGRLWKGILKAGVYKSKGKFTIFKEYDELLPSLSLELNATAEAWEEQWSLVITSEEGWLSPHKAAKQKKLQKILLKQSNSSVDHDKPIEPELNDQRKQSNVSLAGDKFLNTKTDDPIMSSMQQSFDKGRRNARKILCINNLRLIDLAVNRYSLEYGAPKGSVPPAEIILGNGNKRGYLGFLKKNPICPEGKAPYRIPKVGEPAVCPNVDLFPDHVSSE